jgi:hypothetical protein
VYVKRNDRWQSVATQVTVVKEETVSRNVSGRGDR